MKITERLAKPFGRPHPGILMRNPETHARRAIFKKILWKKKLIVNFRKKGKYTYRQRPDFNTCNCCFPKDWRASWSIKTSQIWNDLSDSEAFKSQDFQVHGLMPIFLQCLVGRGGWCPSFKGHLPCSLEIMWQVLVGGGLTSDIFDIHAQGSISLIQPVFCIPTSFAKKEIRKEHPRFPCINVPV